MWMFYGLAAAVTWGVLYASLSQVLPRISVFSLATLQFLLPGVVLLVAYGPANVLSEVYEISAQPWGLAALLGSAVLYSGGLILAGASISCGNPITTALVELSYLPMIPVFSWLLFADNQLNLSVGIGSAFIITGVVLMMTDQAPESPSPPP